MVFNDILEMNFDQKSCFNLLVHNIEFKWNFLKICIPSPEAKASPTLILSTGTALPSAKKTTN